MAGSPPGGQPPAGNRSPPAVARRSPPEVLRFLARSDARQQVLLALAADGATTRPALGAATGVPRSTVYRTLGELDDRGLVAWVGDGEGEGAGRHGDEEEQREGGRQGEAGRRYVVTPTGALLADRLRSLVDAIAVTRLLQALADGRPREARDAAGGADGDSTTRSEVEVLVASAGDPRAPARRLADRLAAASRVRLLVPADGRVALEAALGARPAGEGSIEAVVAAELVESATADAPTARALRTLVAAPDVALAVADADVPGVAGVADVTAFVAVPDGAGSDGAGSVLGYVETDDAALRAGVERAYEATASEATALDPGAVAPPDVR